MAVLKSSGKDWCGTAVLLLVESLYRFTGGENCFSLAAVRMSAVMELFVLPTVCCGRGATATTVVFVGEPTDYRGQMYVAGSVLRVVLSGLD